MKRHHLAINVLVCAVLLSVSAGCAFVVGGSAVAAGTYVYIEGHTLGTYETDVPNAFHASVAACEELGIPVIKERQAKTDAEVQGKYNGERVVITMKQVTDTQTEISVRVGLIGNEASARRIHGVIQNKL